MNAHSQSKDSISYFHTTHNAFGFLQDSRDQGTHLKIKFQFLKLVESDLNLNITASSFPLACSELWHSSQCIPPATLATYDFNPDLGAEKQEHDRFEALGNNGLLWLPAQHSRHSAISSSII